MSVAPPRPNKISDEPIKPDPETSVLTNFLFGSQIVTSGKNKFTIWAKGYRSINQGDGLFRELIKAHITEHTEELLIKAIQGEMQNLPKTIQEEIDNQPEFAEKTIVSYSKNQKFWINFNARDAFYEFLNIACETLSVTQEFKELIRNKFIIRRFEVYGTHFDLLKDEIRLHDIAFSIFQIIILRFAIFGIRSSELRKFWGIKKSFFS